MSGSTPRHEAPREAAERTRSRILDAAIRVFATEGFGASLRTVATSARVSAPLILHYFGSRGGLRAACDARFRDEITGVKLAFLNPATAASSLRATTEGLGEYAPQFGYLLRVLRAGDATSAAIVDALAGDAEGYLAEGEALGTIRPSAHPEARARMLVEMSLGVLLFEFPLDEGRIDLDALPAALDAYWRRTAIPLLEIATSGYLADSRLLDALRNPPPDLHGDTEQSKEHA